MKAPLPHGEADRIEVLRSYEILDTPPEPEFDDLAALAADLCEAPMAVISLTDESRNWYKARVGVPFSETARDIAFCSHAILSDDLLIVPDAMRDERFKGNPLVTGEPGIRFYAGAPLLTAEGHAIGAICVLDHVARDLPPERRRALKTLSQQVVNLLEIRRDLRRRRAAISSKQMQAVAVPRSPRLTVDVLIEPGGDPSKVVLIRRRNPPPGWAIPGGFVEWGETVEAAAAREALEETGLDVRDLRQFHVYSDPSRDPRGHTVAVVFIAQADGVPVGGDDASEARVFALNDLPDEIAFDHRSILADYHHRR